MAWLILILIFQEILTSIYITLETFLLESEEITANNAFFVKEWLILDESVRNANSLLIFKQSVKDLVLN